MLGTTKIPIGVYVYTVLKVEDGIGKYIINDGLTSKVMPLIVNKINIAKPNKITLVVRSSREHYTEGPFPTVGQLDNLVSNIKKEVRVFYQEPWPAEVPDLQVPDSLVIRFGYNEGCEFDKEVASGATIKTDRKNGSYPMLLGKDDSVDLVTKLM